MTYELGREAAVLRKSKLFAALLHHLGVCLQDRLGQLRRFARSRLTHHNHNSVLLYKGQQIFKLPEHWEALCDLPQREIGGTVWLAVEGIQLCRA